MWFALKDEHWICRTFTIADAYLFAVLRWALLRAVKLNLEGLGTLRRCLRMAERRRIARRAVSG